MNDNSNITVFYLYPQRGVLTGKYKRGAELSSLEGTRITHSTALKAKGQSAPSWDNFADNDFYWNLLSSAKGKSTFFFTNLETFLQKYSILMINI